MSHNNTFTTQLCLGAEEGYFASSKIKYQKLKSKNVLIFLMYSLYF